MSDEPLSAREARAARREFERYAKAIDKQDPDVLLTWPDVARDVREWLQSVQAS